MGQAQINISSNNVTQNTQLKFPTFVEAQISMSDESVVRPNGYFPPEIVVFILKYADLISCIRASQSCKLWYESIQEVFKNMYISQYSPSEVLEDDWKVNFFRRTVMDRNLAKGVWWSEAFSARHYPKWDSFSYVASFEGNKVIYNNHHIQVTSYSDSKYFSAAYELDLDTMTRQEIPYGTIYANGFKLQTLIKDDYSEFDWREYEVHGGSTTHIIKRQSHDEEEQQYWRRMRHQLFINMDGTPTVLTTNSRRYFSEEIQIRHIEVADLRTGEIIAKPEISALSVLGLIGDAIIAEFADGIFFVNIYTTERIPLDFPSEGETDAKFHYCKDNNLLGCATRGGVIRFYKWPSFEFVSQTEIQSVLPAPKDETSLNPEDDLFVLHSFAFDKSKLLAAVTANTAPFYAVFDMRTGTLVQTFHNSTDGHSGSIYLAPNGKIVTSHENLAVHDFLSPMLCKDIPIVFAELNSESVTKTMVPATELATFATKKLEAVPSSIFYYTFFASDKSDNLYRLTVIGSHGQDRNDWETYRQINWTQLPKYLEAWHSDDQVRNTFQIVYSGCTYQAEFNSDIAWGRLRKALLVYERFDEKTNSWDFAEPLATEDIAGKRHGESEQEH